MLVLGIEPKDQVGLLLLQERSVRFVVAASFAVVVAVEVPVVVMFVLMQIVASPIVQVVRSSHPSTVV